MIKVVYEDKNIIGVIKPFGMPTQKDKTGDKSLLEILQEERKMEDLFLLHRLDRPVGGIIILAKNKEANAFYSQQFKDRNVDKTYFAVVSGKAEDEKRLENFIFKNQRLNTSKVVNKNSPNSKLAVLNYNLLEYNASENLSLVSIKLETGRHHQIRVQMAYEGLGLYGDAKYGEGKFRGVNIGLWSKKISLDRMDEKDRILIECDLPREIPFNMFGNKDCD